MKTEATEFLPLARRDGIITKEVEGELLVYDVTRDKAHCLNETAAAVWHLCDGRRSVSEISEQWAVGGERKAEDGRQSADARRRTNGGIRQSAEDSEPTPVTQHLTPDTRYLIPDSGTPHPTSDTQIVWLALDQLRRSRLLEEYNDKTIWPPAISGLANMSRREAVRRIGLGAAIALPIVMSMTVPTAVEAAVSCGHHCASCSSPVDCCGTCSTSVPGCTGSPRCT